MLLSPYLPLPLNHMAEEGDPSTVAEGGARLEQLSPKICKGAVAAEDTIPAPAQDAGSMHPCTAQEPDPAPVACQGLGQGGGVACGDDIDDSGASGASGDSCRVSFRKSWEGAVTPDDTFPHAGGRR